jgi:hypothetical protein
MFSQLCRRAGRMGAAARVAIDNLTLKFRKLM